MEIANLEGPGAILRIWSANANAGKIKIYIDDNPVPVLDADLTKFLSGRVQPFYKPLVQASSGGGVSYFPIPYSKRCRITIDPDDLFYYQITYAKFKPNTSVVSFKNPNLVSLTSELPSLGRVLSAWSHPQRRLHMTNIGNKIFAPSTNQTDLVHFRTSRGGRINSLGFRLMAVGGSSLPNPRKIMIRVFFDYHIVPDIEAPLSDLMGSPFAFGSGSGNLFTGYKQSGSQLVPALSLPMPFGQSARITVENGNDFDIGLEVHGDFQDGVTFDSTRAGYLRARFMQEFLTFGVPHNWLTLRGDRGHFVGVVQAMFHRPTQAEYQDYIKNPHYQVLGFLEGDEQFRVDNETFDESPRENGYSTVLAPFNGTGAEDYFNSAYYFANGPMIFPLHGITTKYENGPLGVAGAFRFHLLDTINFEQSIDAQIEHGGLNDLGPNTYFSSTVFWYSSGNISNHVRGTHSTPRARDVLSLGPLLPSRRR